MNLIKLFLLGACGYLLAALYDIALLYKKTWLVRLLYAGFFLTGLPFVFFFFLHTSPHPVALQVVLLLMMGFFLLLTIYSVLLELPLHGDGTLYTKGTYSICRHPGFLWYSLFTLLTASYFWYAPLAWVCLGYICCNLALITLEDVVLFPRMFTQYETYKKTTPFLIPF
ncbi:MAG: hypothetical protein GX836_05295 [Spirochaetales bacterium]|nr:hypothetical protein [Spirochaetales bacterium]